MGVIFVWTNKIVVYHKHKNPILAFFGIGKDIVYQSVSSSTEAHPSYSVSDDGQTVDIHSPRPFTVKAREHGRKLFVKLSHN